MADTSIEWTDKVWNPVRGCVKISPGCKHCYAETFAERFRGVAGHPYEQGFDVRTVPHKLEEPLRWKQPRRIFVNSMSDLFQDGVPFEYVDQVFAVMGACEDRGLGHIFQVLTKRPDLMAEYMRTRAHRAWNLRRISTEAFPPRNVWLGVSVEDRQYGLPRIDVLRNVPAAVRFLSIEPLLEDLGQINLAGISWAIVGGESGHGARPCDVAWIRSIVEQCQSASVACFVKQLGAWCYSTRGSFDDLYFRTKLVCPKPGEEDRWYRHGGHKKGGDASEWPAELAVRQFPDMQPEDRR